MFGALHDVGCYVIKVMSEDRHHGTIMKAQAAYFKLPVAVLGAGDSADISN